MVEGGEWWGDGAGLEKAESFEGMGGRERTVGEERKVVKRAPF